VCCDAGDPCRPRLPHCLRAIDTIFLAVGNNKRRLHMSIQQRESVHCNVCTSSTFASLCAWHTPTLSFQNRPPALAQPGGGPLQKGSDANTTRRFRPNDPLSLAAARRLQQYGCSWARLGTGTCRADGGVSCCPGRAVAEGGGRCTKPELGAAAVEKRRPEGGEPLTAPVGNGESSLPARGTRWICLDK
jgi:hypothetical protein